jgi:hypothetical protein
MNGLADLKPDAQQVFGRECDGSANSPGSRAKTVSIMPCKIDVSVMTGKCGPCCSIAATGRTATVVSGSSSENSLDLSSPQNRFRDMASLSGMPNAAP